ncbi:MAG: EAL domain-containing protein [Pelomonas sp.]|nr:EAL domain-containing protein [Roseateles sp.]
MPDIKSVEDDDLLEFLDGPEQEHADSAGDKLPWRILVVDDDEDVHRATELAMQGLLVEGMPLEFLHAYSAREAREKLAAEKRLAVALLDVVMESEDAGLQLVRHIREELAERALRIVLRTGQPGYAPEIETVQTYDINDYKTKSELTRTRMFTLLTSAVRSYRQICELEAGRRGLEMIVDAGSGLAKVRDLKVYADGVLTQVCALLGSLPQGIVCAEVETDGGPGARAARVVAAAGQYAGLVDHALDALPLEAQRARIRHCLGAREHGFDAGACLFFALSDGRGIAALIDTGHPLRDIDQQLLRAFATSVAVGFENVVLYDRLVDQAFNDPLLQLPNRARFVELLDQNLRDPAGITLALVDMDDFADINDAFGHRFADEVLQAVTQRLVRALGSGTAMARVGPDVFGLIGPQARVNDATIAACFVEPFEVGGERLKLSATAGLVRLGESSAYGSELLLDAQIALKRAKQSHRGAAQYFSTAMGTGARERFKLLKGLREAYEHEHLTLVYQPQVDLATRRPIGCEALLRWRKADGTFVPPDQFIPLAEQSGLIVPIGEFVLRTACLQLKRLTGLGHAGFRMCVNVSLAQFRDPDFIPSLQRVLGETGVDARLLELEITESMAMEDTELIHRLLADIRRCGASVAIDDFGTGFSSLSQLRQLQVERLKIDRAFVQEAEASSAGATIAKMVVDLGRALGLTVIAEGIETETQRAHLLALGCHEGQGWLFGRPMASDPFETWLAEHSAAA